MPGSFSWRIQGNDDGLPVLPANVIRRPSEAWNVDAGPRHEPSEELPRKPTQQPLRRPKHDVFAGAQIVEPRKTIASADLPGSGEAAARPRCSTTGAGSRDQVWRARLYSRGIGICLPSAQIRHRTGAPRRRHDQRSGHRHQHAPRSGAPRSTSPCARNARTNRPSSGRPASRSPGG